MTKAAVAEALMRQGGRRAGGLEAGAGLGELEAERQRLAELWAAEAPAAPWHDDLEGGAGHACPKCGGPLQWAGARTVLVCAACKTKHASPGADERESAYAAARAARNRRGGGELERQADPAAEREAKRLRRAKAELLEDAVRELIRLADPDAQDIPRWQQQARELRAVARAYLPDVGEALAADLERAPGAPDSALDELAGELGKRRNSPEVLALESAAGQAAARRQWAADVARAQAGAQAERQAAEAEARRERLELAQTHRALAGAARGRGPASAGAEINELARLIRQRSEAIARNGACEFCRGVKRPAVLVFGALDSYSQAPWRGEGCRPVRACEAHAGKAAQAHNGHIHVLYQWPAHEVRSA